MRDPEGGQREFGSNTPGSNVILSRTKDLIQINNHLHDPNRNHKGKNIATRIDQTPDAATRPVECGGSADCLAAANRHLW